MRGEFKLPTKLPGKPVKNSQKVVIDNDVYSSPYEVRVRPPSTFVAPAVTNQPVKSNDAEQQQQQQQQAAVSDDVAADDGSTSKLTIIRLGRSLQTNSNDDDNGEPLPLLSEQDAEQLSRFVD